MKVGIIGTGYVGLVAGAGFAETGNDVWCVDVDKRKIDKLKRGIVPIYEPGLEELIKRNRAEGRMRFSTDTSKAVKESQILFIAVGTPALEDGGSDLKHVLAAADAIGRAANGYKIVVLKSTVPVGAADKVRQVIAKLTSHEFDVVNNPEFLKEGAALEDFMKPDRVVVGAANGRCVEVMRELYAPFLRTGAPFLVMDNRSAELTKYAANAMLAARISFMNEIANLCHGLGADIELVRQGIGTDRRIGPSFLFAGLGYGGSCFPKDVRSLIDMGHRTGLPMEVASAVHRVNERQKSILVDRIVDFFASGRIQELEAFREREGSGRLAHGARRSKSAVGRPPRRARLSRARCLEGRTFALWGLSFKPQTDDMREAPSAVIIRGLLKRGAKIRAYDPEAMPAARAIFGEGIAYCETNYGALEGADALILVTEWNVFRNPDFLRMKKLLRLPVIFDGRNQYDPAELSELGFTYTTIGRPGTG